MKKKRPTWIPVVAGLIRRKDQFLLGFRPNEEPVPSVWEFPGGKIEPGESPEDALIRELDEELGITVEVGPLRLSVTHNYGDVGVIILFYDVIYWQGEPRAIYHEDLKWAGKKELKSLPLPEANKKSCTESLPLYRKLGT